MSKSNQAIRNKIREGVARILVKWSMPTRQAAIIEITNLLWESVPCCGHTCRCRNLEQREEVVHMAKTKKAAVKKAPAKKAPAKKAKKK